MRSRTAPLALAIAASVSSSLSCSKSLDMSRVRASISQGIAAQSGMAVNSVTCPESRKAQPGDKFECRVQLADGWVSVDVAQDEYANVTWKQRESMIDMRDLEASILSGLASKGRRDFVVRCPGTKRPSITGGTFSCVADSPRTPNLSIPVSIRDTQATVTWSVPGAVIDR